MVFLFCFVLSVLAICAATVWSRVGREPAAARPWRADVKPPPDEEVASPEGVLAAQLARSDISHDEYVEAMEQLAARDEFRHPLVVPPDR
ncbi:hypothetical protein [Paractinoplanes durhamensis]|uniref:SHOCT domain-containing protein n=1 Tax=Paractinoplanes durhamensis TaxID=113563 RepID=A0ABQ3ZBD5_9ACTN|nr:hypothetical protein [Actinoplanes durhamensis]GIE07151.1 hypothetical protein Adu01nite_85010 [Actinoplanes durhamensis]